VARATRKSSVGTANPRLPWRSFLRCTGADSGPASRARSYYRAVLLLESRFPLQRKGAVGKIVFTWADAFRLSRKATGPDLQLEKAALLWNLGAAYCAVAAGADRGAQEGTKAACSALQSAAGAFEALADVIPKLSAPATPDLSAESAAAAVALCLAQAQEIMYEAAVAGNKSAALQGKLAAAAAAFWERGAKQLGAPPLREAADRATAASASLRGAVCHAKAQMHAAAAAAADSDKATEAGRLAAAVAALQRELRVARTTLPAAGLASAAALEAQLVPRADLAARDAASVYLVRVPPPEALPPLAAAVAVKATPLSAALACSEERLLRTVVPDGAAKALSRYSDAVDGIVRSAASALGDASDAARLRLRELELPELLDALSAGALPPPLLADLADVVRAGGLAAVAQQLPRLGDAARACGAALAAATATLDADGAASPQHAASVAGLRARIEGYGASMAAAANSDAALAQRCAAAEPRVATLNPDAAALAAPRLQPPLVPSDADTATVSTLRSILAELEHNAAERAGLEDMVRDMRTSDDVLPRIMAAPAEAAEALIEAELRKYDAPRAAVAANVAACESLLSRLGGAHAAFCAVHDVAGYRGRAAAYCDDLRESLRAYRELHRAAAEGQSFYAQLRAAAAQAAEEAAGWAAARRAAAEEAAAEEARRAALHAQAAADGERAAAMQAAEAAERARAQAAWAQQAQANQHAQAMAAAQAAQAQHAAAQAQAQMQAMALAGAPPSYPPAGGAYPPQYGAPPPQQQGPPQALYSGYAPQQGAAQPPQFGYAQPQPPPPPYGYAPAPPGPGGMPGWPTPPQQYAPR